MVILSEDDLTDDRRPEVDDDGSRVPSEPEATTTTPPPPSGRRDGGRPRRWDETTIVKHGKLLFAAIVLIASLLMPHIVGVSGYTADPTLTGSYCGSRPNACCRGRHDHCAVPFLGTLCYCDEFCNRTHTPGLQDCCPDYYPVCLGIRRPQMMCYINGHYVHQNDTYRINCKECTCVWNGSTMSFNCDETKECLVNTATVSYVNEHYGKFGWHARNYSEFWGRDLADGFSRRLGTLLSTKKVLSMQALNPDYDARRLPRSFDARQKWRGSIELPRDQGWCNASWAISTTAVVSDRLNIHLKSRHMPLAPQHLLSCNSKAQDGCDGGHLSRAWVFIRRFGLVHEQCYPWVGQQTRCIITKRKAANESRCATSRVMRSPLYRVAPVYKVAGEEDIMYEIKKSGPVQATMRVYQDFFVYGGGIYRCGLDIPNARNQRRGLHSVRIIGWGEEQQNGQLVKYWIAANSWGQWWGENGYFRIRRGNNDCKIEDFVLAAWAAQEKTPGINYLNPLGYAEPYNNQLSNVIHH